ncbi:FK506-binding protein 15 isoform X3 [Megalobrama amblycephala]|uniref:FK506-binding protein 15 isoform X3 n=1 Tax=Megalobrama amblycephala TaxID=75352 RepID=UPI002013D6E7|nr:FK506-binding protein 15 isoform X3 [Megalobrama amblycephala]
MEKIKDIIPDYHDGDFLCPKSGAKLASLFGLDRAESQGNESFQFTAPKQPKKTCAILGPPPQKPAPPPCAPAVMFATAVHAFCFVNGQYVKQGKIGAAVLGNHVTKEYKILLYGSKQKPITTARIYRGFVLTVQPCNYVTFYDDQQQSWSLMFDSEKSRPEFCKEVCVARWNSEASSDSLVTQDLVQGEGQAVDVGDTVEVAYSGWLLQNHSLGQIFDSSLGKEKLQRVKLGAGKALRGWEDGMLGMQKGGRRLIIVPPSMVSKGVPNHVPENSTLVFDVEIHRVKFSKERHSGGSVDTFSTSPGTCSDTLSEENTSQLVTTDTEESKDQTPKGKVESVSENLTTSGASKARLMSRIAKMGQAMLPFLTGAIPAQPDPSDSETEDVSESGHTCDLSPSHSPSPKPAQMPCSPPSLLCQPDDAQKQDAVPPHADSDTTQGFQPYSFRQNPYFSSQLNSFPSICPSHIPYQTPDITTFLISEARQHNAEILLAIEKVAHRMDLLTCKVDELQKEGRFSFGLSSVSLETNKILHNIQRIIQESMALKNEVLEKSSQVEEQNHKTGELSGQNKRNLEQQHTQTRRLQDEQGKIHLSEELSSSTTQAYQLQQEMVNLQQMVTEIQTDLSAALEDKHKHCAQISLLQEQVKELVKQGEQSEQRWRAEKQKCKEMETVIQNMDEEMQDLRAEKYEDLKKTSENKKKQFETQLAVQVKRVMNGVFQSLKTEFDPQESYSGRIVCEILQNTIKSITMKLLSEIWEIESDIDKVEEEYQLRSTDLLSDGKHAEGKQ